MRTMSPRNDNREPDAKPNVTVNIPHDEKLTVPPAAAPPLPELEPLPIRPINITDNIPTPPPAVPSMPPAYPHEFHEREGRHWPVALVYIVMAFLVALLVVFAGRWIYRKAIHSTTNTTKSGIPDQSKVPAVPPANTPPNNPSSGVSNNQNTQTTPTTASGQLPNNGPGDVIAIFVGTALAVGGLHFLYNLRRQD